MNLKNFRRLQQENPYAAMIFDLSERFPRGPKGKLRKSDYHKIQVWNDEFTSDKLFGGALGYDIFELYAVAKKGISAWDLADLTTEIEECGMGHASYEYDSDGRVSKFIKRRIFKQGPQITRRVNRLNERFTHVRNEIAKKSTKNLYNVQIGRGRIPVVVFGDSEQHARMQYEMMMKAGFDAAAKVGLMSSTGGWNDDPLEAHTYLSYRGPSHGVHEIMEANQVYIDGLDEQMKKMQDEIKKLEQKIAAAQDCRQLVEMFTLQSCAAARQED